MDRLIFISHKLDPKFPSQAWGAGCCLWHNQQLPVITHQLYAIITLLYKMHTDTRHPPIRTVLYCKVCCFTFRITLYFFHLYTQKAMVSLKGKGIAFMGPVPSFLEGRLHVFFPLFYTEMADRWKLGGSERAVSHIVLWLVLKYVGLPSQTMIKLEAMLSICTGGNTSDLHQMRKGPFLHPLEGKIFSLGP